MERREAERGLQITDALTRLSTAQSQVMRLRFGLEGWKRMSYRQIAKMTGKSPFRIKQIEKEAIDKLNSDPIATKALRPFYTKP